MEVINSQEYWAKREAEALKHYITDEKEYERQIKQIYSNMLDACTSEINAFYGKYASKEGISLAEAKKRVRELDIAAYERKAKRYVKDKDFSAKANEEMRLYNATMKINRLEMLKANIGLELISGHDELEKFMEGILKGRTEEELKRQAGILGKTVKSNAKKAHAIVNGSFHSGTFSDRIWQYQDLMRQELGALLQTGLIQGKNPRALTKDLKKYFIGKDGTGGMRYCMERLMRTELARVQTEAQKQSYLEDEIEEFEFIVNGGCCPICEGLKGKRFKVTKMMPGENAPPMHPHCRCSTAPFFDRKEFDALLDHIDKGGTIEEWNKLKTKNVYRPVTTGNAKSDIISNMEIGGMDVTVTNAKHTFYGSDQKDVDAVIYTTTDGTQFVFPKHYNKEYQQMTPEQAISAWQKVPQKLRKKAQNTIEFVDYYNPDDEEWAKRYKTFARSYATGGDVITFYRHDDPHSMEYVVRTYCHEIGHYIDTQIAKRRKNYSEEAEWTKARSDDRKISNKKSCTDYGVNSPTEDFAESVVEYVQDKETFANDFPNRAALLAKIIE